MAENPSSNIDPDPWGNYYFSLEIDKVEVAHFLECSGIKSAAEVFEIEEGGVNDMVHKRSGYSSWDNIVLKKGIAQSMKFVEWRDTYLRVPESGWEERGNTSAAIVVHDNSGKELRRFTILSAWPVSWEGPSLNSRGSELATETIEIAHEGILIDADAPVPPEPPPEPPEKFETEPVQFELAESELTDEGQQTMDDLGEDLNEHPEVETIWIEGHTCTQPCEPDGTPKAHSAGINKPLSSDRANTCKGELEQSAPDKTYIATGYGYDHPVASNATPAGRARNRRTEFWTSPRSGKRPNEL